MSADSIQTENVLWLEEPPRVSQIKKNTFKLLVSQKKKITVEIRKYFKLNNNEIYIWKLKGYI